MMPTIVEKPGNAVNLGLSALEEQQRLSCPSGRILYNPGHCDRMACWLKRET
jgi:hypothetical protein